MERHCLRKRYGKLKSMTSPRISNILSKINLQSLLSPHWLNQISPYFIFFIKKFQKIQFKRNPILYRHYTFRWKNQKLYCQGLKIANFFFAEMPQTHFLSKLKRYFSFKEYSSKTSEELCSVKKIITFHLTTLSTGIVGYIEIPMTTVKPALEWKI